MSTFIQPRRTLIPDEPKLHSPAWWQELFAASGVLDVQACTELDDGVIMHEEKVAVAPPRGYLGMNAAEARDLEMRQILYGREHEPHMTVFVAATSRKRQLEQMR